MKVNWGLIKVIVLVGLVVFLYSFTNKRNSARNLSKIEVEFVDENDPFITLKTVDKLLIQKYNSVTNVLKERLVLKEAEKRLLQNDMIRDAQVFITVDGVLGAKIEQRNPVARVAAINDFYIDADGKKMPLSKVYSARVPLVTGNIETDFTVLTSLLLTIRDDNFLNQTIVGLHVSKNNFVIMKVRKQDFQVNFGKLIDEDKKFQNFKAFYQQALNDGTLSEYKSVDLQFGSQVVATKK
ncbi:cell division protein FtsQ [Patiriisocius marinistellae]|uniref:Cell division protein FtsQ n=1 Tax=Patiriisocius marinistellae TaxID=2494560 RepID=A0A5J4G2L3_9FLAO|nr:hypothetical protein [Patiriisocius marinistellae]GEQ86966.1 cell division protein FtsQ [Patiriisocius marinistellae]